MIRTRKVASSRDADMNPLWGQGRGEKVCISNFMDSWQEDVGTEMNVWPVVLECVVCVAGLEIGRLISRLLSWIM